RQLLGDLADGPEGARGLAPPFGRRAAARGGPVGIVHRTRLGGFRRAHALSPAWLPAPSRVTPRFTRSFRTWEARNTRTRRGLMGTSSPVLGLRPTLSPFSRTMKLPKDEILTVSPLASVSEISFSTAATRSPESLRERPAPLNSAPTHGAGVAGRV